MMTNHDGQHQDLVSMAVDAVVCIGSGRCELLDETTFYLNDDTMIATVIGAGRLPRDRAEGIVDGCPSGAISIGAGAMPPTHPTEGD